MTVCINNLYGKLNLYGNPTDPTDLNAYLHRKLLDTGDNLCFVQGYPFWFSIITPFLLAMLLIFTSYIILTVKIHQTNTKGVIVYKDYYTEMKKLFVLFFTISACWIFMVFAASIDALNGSDIVFDYIFVIFKGLQTIVLWLVLNYKKILIWLNVRKNRISRTGRLPTIGGDQNEILRGNQALDAKLGNFDSVISSQPSYPASSSIQYVGLEN